MRRVRGCKARVVAVGVGIMAALVLLVLAPAARAQTTPEPNRPPCDIPPCGPDPWPAIRATFYYPWWNGFDTATQTPREKWSECSSTWDDSSAHFHPDFNADGDFVKATDLYDDRSTSVMITHMQRMVAANITGLIASWWGPGTGEDWKFLRYILPAADSVRWVDVTTYYEEERPGGREDEQIRNYVDEMLAASQDNPARFLRLWDSSREEYVRPVLFVYDPGYTNCGILDLWKAALDAAESVFGVRPLLVVDMADDVQTRCTNHSAADFAWHAYAPAGSAGYTQTWAYGQRQTNTVRPGFWPCTMTSESDGQVRSLSAWQSNVNWANSHQPKFFQLITSWNEWLEMTAVEPSSDWHSTSGLGQYLDILAQNPL